MIELSNCLRLLDEGFSLITVTDKKVPNIKWLEYQKKAISKEKFINCYNLPTTENIGIVTGYADLECIDIDLKVFSTAKEKLDFWNEFISFVKDNILDFEDKFALYKTKNEGYHIIYKSKRVDKNIKIASLKGHTQAILESRGIGGYIFVYEGKNELKKTYKDVDYISDNDRAILWQICKSYNFIEDKKIDAEINKIKKEHDGVGLTVWDDFNNKNSILDIVQEDFTVVRSLSDKFIIKRHGSESPHSGYIYKETNTMYLYSTATIYKHEKLYNPFTAYSQKHYNFDLSLTAKELYKEGYGERIKPKEKFEVERIDIPKDDLIFPIDIFPKSLQHYILENYKNLNNSIDYMGCSLLFVTSIAIGNSTLIKVKNGWFEPASVWICLIGSAGVGKTPSITAITNPINKINNREIKRYIKEYDKYQKYESLSYEEQKLKEVVKKPKKSQFIVDDITIEALIDLHSDNKNGVGIFKDELAGWFKDMNKYREGSDLEHWLSSWSNKQININRKTAKNSFVERAFMPVLGGIQPSVLDSFSTSENNNNGFLDRMLFCYPDLIVEKYVDNELDESLIKWYEDFILAFYETIQKSIKWTDEYEIEPMIAYFSEEAKKEWIRIFDEITDLQNSDHETEYLKSMLPKLKSYIPRFSLIINCLDAYELDEDVPYNIIRIQSILKAEKLAKYFISNAKKMKFESKDRQEIKKDLIKNEGKTNFEKFKVIFEKNNKIKKNELANLLGVSRTQIYKYIDELKKQKT
jgi:hypothetical protein